MDLLLHPTVSEALRPDRFAPGKTYLFVGRPGQGRVTAAKELARELNCQHHKEPCASCRLFAKDVYPDFVVVQPDGASVKIEQVRALQQQLALSPYQAASFRFAVIDSAETLTTEAQNALLKLIEEPPAQTTIVLAATDPEALLPTVQSRAQVIYFPPVETQQLTEWLAGHNARPARELAELSGGVPGLALQLSEDANLRASYQSADQIAQDLCEQPLFDRLLAVKDLTAHSEDIPLVAERLVSRARRMAREGNAHVLPAAEGLLRYMNAGVGARAALEAFVVAV